MVSGISGLGRAGSTWTWPYPRDEFAHLTAPIFIYVGRVAVEKNIGAFLDLELPGSKVVVGGGPQLASLQRDYPNVTFTEPRYGEALARAYSGADVFVFPSRTDTFGLVLLEALACGTPVAAFPVTGPKDVLTIAQGKIGSVSDDLRIAALDALTADRAACRAHSERYSWRACAEVFLSHLVPNIIEARSVEVAAPSGHLRHSGRAGVASPSSDGD